jgi:hypothetical protein
VSAEKQVNPQVTSLREHPTAGPAIRRAKGLAGLAGFSVTAFIGFEGGVPFALGAIRALEVGVACNVVVWAGAVLVWKRLLIAQAAGIARSRRQAGATDGAE